MRRLMPALALVGAAGAAGAVQPEPGDLAVLQALDKVTARISAIEAPIDRSVRFGTLRIVVRFCSKTPPEEPPEATAFLDIDEVRPGERTVKLFSGWMFASSPALSGLEHPVYDVWVVDCRTASSSERVTAE